MSCEFPLRVLHLTLGADAGGLSQYIVSLGSAMIAQGHDVTVAGDTGAWQWAFDRSPLKYVPIPLKGNWFNFRKSVRMMRNYLRDHPVDVIHTHYRRATLLGRTLQVRGTPPIVYTLHLSHISLKFPRNLFTDFGDVAHVASRDAQQWLVDDVHIAPETIRFIPHGVDVNRYSLTRLRERDEARDALHLSRNDRVAIFVGRLDHPKNEDWLLRVAIETRESMPNLKIFLIGEGPHEASLRTLIAAHDLSTRVFLVGHQDPLPYYRAADALLLPSAREGFSFVCAEAMATGIPALRTRTSGTAELILENVTGRSVPIDRDAFVRESIAFLKDESALKRMGIAAADHVRRNFTFDQQLARTTELYRSMLPR